MRPGLPISFVCAALLAAGGAGARPLRVVATVPDLGSLVKLVGGDEVSVTVLVKGLQDPHFIEPRPSFVRKLHQADLYVQVGMELEIGWAPVLLRQARNSKVRPGAAGFVDASTVIAPLEVPQVAVDRTAGDVHPYGNPHYLTDPVNGLRVAALLRDKLAQLRPESAAKFRSGYEALETELVSKLVGAELVERYGAPAILRHIEAGTLERILGGQEDTAALGGWLGDLRKVVGTRAVQDHRIWAYIARRFGVVLVGELEPKPGIAPTTRHLSEVVTQMRAQGVHLVLSAPYFDARHARWVAERTDSRVAEMAHQVGARPGTDDYPSTVDYNVRQLLGGS